MPVRTCVHCAYSTNNKWLYECHLKSVKHLNTERNLETGVSMHTCENCDKKYVSFSGLWRHKQKCQAPPPTNMVLDQEAIAIMTNTQNMVAHINNVIEERIVQPTTQVNNNTNITNNNTMNNNVNIKVEYLNKNYGNAMNIGQFVERIKFLRSDFLEIDKSRFFIDAATKILCNKIESVPREERPFHCEPPNKKYASATFFVKDNDEWRVEHQNAVEFDLRYAEFEEESDKMFMIRFFEQYSEKFYDVYLTMKQTDQLFQRIENKVNVCGQSQTHIDLMHGITDLEALKLPSTEPTPPTQIVIE